MRASSSEICEATGISDPEIAYVYLSDISRKARRVARHKTVSGVRYGEKFTTRAGMYTFSLWDYPGAETKEVW